MGHACCQILNCCGTRSRLCSAALVQPRVADNASHSRPAFRARNLRFPQVLLPLILLLLAWLAALAAGRRSSVDSALEQLKALEKRQQTWRRLEAEEQASHEAEANDPDEHAGNVIRPGEQPPAPVSGPESPPPLPELPASDDGAGREDPPGGEGAAAEGRSG